MSWERETYTAEVKKRGIGWTADLALYHDDNKIGLDGPMFWRPTRAWVVRRADRHVRFGLWLRHRARHVQRRGGSTEITWIWVAA